MLVMLSRLSQMLSYASVSEYYSQPDDSVYLGFLSQDLEGDTNALQAFLGEWGFSLVVTRGHWSI